MLKIRVDDWYDLYTKHTFEFNEGVTCLIGRNGAGKSTLLKELKEKLDKKKIKYFYYDNEETERDGLSRFSFYGDYERMARNFSASEGQKMRYNFEDYIGHMGDYVRKCVKDKKQVIILLDGLDSGISLDYIDYLKKELFSLVFDNCKEGGVEVYLIIAANNFEFCRNEDCIRVNDGMHLKFYNYDDFRKIFVEE